MFDVLWQLAPRLAAGAVLLIGAVAGIHHAATGRRSATRRATADRGTGIVLFGCYALALLALCSPVVPAPLLPQWGQWAGAGSAAVGLVFRLRSGARVSAVGDVLLWTGVAAAASSLPVWSALMVSLLAAHATQAHRTRISEGQLTARRAARLIAPASRSVRSPMS